MTDYKVTDAYVTLRVYSKTLSVEQLSELAGFEPQETGVMGAVRKRGQPIPANYIILITENMVSEKNINLHIDALERRLPPGRFVDRFPDGDIDIYLTIYWWTTELSNFQLTPESVQTLGRVGVPAHFNFLIDEPVVAGER